MQIKRRIFILLAAALLVTGIAVLLNRASFDPNFSVVDVLSGATERSRRSTSESTDDVTSWGYHTADLALPDESAYFEETIETAGVRYVLLRKTKLPDGTLRILSDESNPGYAAAVRQAAACYENLGHAVEVRECGETMMLSLVHAEHFDLFLLREEAGS